MPLDLNKQPCKWRISLPVICPDYDETCQEFTYAEALECWEGFPNNAHAIAMGIELAQVDGHCPILDRLN